MVLDLDNPKIRWIAPTAVGCLAIAGIGMNYQFGFSLGHTLAERYTMGGVSVLLDIIKIFAFSAALIAFSKKLWLKGTIMTVVWLATLSYGLISASGFVTSARNASVAERNASKVDYDRDMKDYKRHEKQIEDTKNSTYWTKTRACTETKTEPTVVKTNCQMYYLSLAAIDEIGPRLRGMPAEESDPQMAALHHFVKKFFDVTREDLSNGIGFFVASMIEFVGSFGVYGFSKSRKPYEFKKLPMRGPLQRHHANDETNENTDDVLYDDDGNTVDAEGNIIKRRRGRPRTTIPFRQLVVASSRN